MKKLLIVLYLTIIMLINSGCSILDNSNATTVSKPGLSYEQYRKILNDAKQNLKFETVSLNFLSTTIDKSLIVMVDKDMSFGKRKYMTLKNEQKDPVQEQIVYENKTEGYKLITSWIYTGESLDNNLLMLKPPEINSVSVYDNLLSFKGILIHVQLLPAEKKIGSLAVDNAKVLTEINDFFEQYELGIKKL